ncbi:MAG: EamA family transporter [Clostridia bacterium]
MWLVFAAGSAFFAGITAILAKCGIKNVNSNLATAIRTVVVLAFSWLMVFVAGVYAPVSEIPVKTLVFLGLSGLATGASWLCYFRALQLGDVNKVAPVDKSSIVLTMLLAWLLLGESIDLWKGLAMAIIAAGTYLMIEKKPSETEEGSKGWKWFFYAALSAIFAALTSILGKIGITDIDSTLGTALRTVVVLIMAWVMVFVSGKQREIKAIDGRSMFFICISGVTTGASWLCYYRALQLGRASYVAPIDKLSILITVLFSRIVLKEKLSRKGAAGLVAITVGTLLLVISDRL